MRISVILLFFLVANLSFAQSSYTLKGLVKDQNDSLVFCNALLLNTSDSSLIKGGLVNNGEFIIRGLEQDTVLLKIVSLDINALYQTIVRPDTTILNLGVIHVNSGILMNKVVASAMKPAFTTGSSGELIVHVKGTILESSTSINDVLSKSPGIIVEEGIVTVFGKGEAIVLLNGKLISSAQLQAIPSSSIERIEVLTNPPAKYDASGKAVVNILLSDNSVEGFSGELVQNTTWARYLQSYSTAAFNYRKGKLSAQLNYAQDHGRNWGANVIKRNAFSDLGTTESINDFKDQSNLKFYNSYNTGFTYDFNAKNSLTIEYLGSVSLSEQDANAITIFRDVEDVKTGITTQNSGENKYLLQSLNLNYSHLFDSLGTNLFAGAQYFYFNSNDDIFIEEEINMEDNFQLFNRRNNSETLISFATAQLDFQKFYANKSTLFEIGVKGIQADNNGEVKFFSKKHDEEEFKFYANLSNDFIYQENIGAIYAQYSRDLHEKIRLSLGVRSELTAANGISKKINETIIDTTYFNLFPNVILDYDLKEDWKLNLSMSSSIKRPTYQALDPFLFYIDSLTTSQGNPQLKPELTYSIESNINFKRYGLKIGYNHTQNAFRYALLPGDNGQTSSTLMQVNVEQEHSYFISLQVPLQLKRYVRSFNIIGTTLDQVIDSRSAFSTSEFQPRFYFFTNNMINIGKLGKIQLAFRLLGTRFDGLYYRKPFYNFSVGWSKSFIDDRLSINLLADDIFHTNIVDGYYELAASKVSYIRKMNTKLFRVTLRYNFGKLKEKAYSSTDIGKTASSRVRK